MSDVGLRGEQHSIRRSQAAPLPAAIVAVLHHGVEGAFCPLVAIVQDERHAELARRRIAATKVKKGGPEASTASGGSFAIVRSRNAHTRGRS